MNRAWKGGMTRAQVGRAPQLELTPEEELKLKNDLLEEQRLAQENITFDKDTAREMMLATEPSRKILHQFTSAVQSSFGRPVIVDDVVNSERFGIFRDAKQEFDSKPATYKKLLDIIFPGKLRHSAAVNPIKPIVKAETEPDKGGEKPPKQKIVMISRSDAKIHARYLAKKAEADAAGASLRIYGD